MAARVSSRKFTSSQTLSYLTGPHARVSTRPSCRRYHASNTLAPRPKPLQLPDGHFSLVPLVNKCSNLVIEHTTHASGYAVGTKTADGTVEQKESVIPFHLSCDTPPHAPEARRPLGLLRPQVIDALERDHKAHEAMGKPSPWSLTYSPNAPTVNSFSFAPWVNEGGQRARTKQLSRLVKGWKRDEMFHDILRGWSNEQYPIYNHLPRTMPHASVDPVAFAIERAALPLFGFPNFGSLLIAYFRSPTTGQTMLWVPRRSQNKRTWPGRLDVTVGGGIGLGDSAFSTIVRECSEEASLDPDYVERFVRPVGVLPFPNRSPADWILPGLYYTFDLPLPSDGSVRPRPNIEDGEVENFELMDVEQVLENLVQDKFKSSSALAVVDFLIRHGFITEKSDPRYVEVCRLLKRPFELPTPWRA